MLNVPNVKEYAKQVFIAAFPSCDAKYWNQSLTTLVKGSNEPRLPPNSPFWSQSATHTEQWALFSTVRTHIWERKTCSKTQTSYQSPPYTHLGEINQQKKANISPHNSTQWPHQLPRINDQVIYKYQQTMKNNQTYEVDQPCKRVGQGTN